MADFKRYNSDATLTVYNARLTKDAEVKGDSFTKLSIVVTSKAEADQDIWFDVIPFDRDAALASHLKKGDVLSVEGFPTMRRYGDGDAKVGFTLKNAKLHIPIELFMELKERGFEPSSGGGEKKTATKKFTPTKKTTRQVQPVSDEDDDLS